LAELAVSERLLESLKKSGVRRLDDLERLTADQWDSVNQTDPEFTIQIGRLLNRVHTGQSSRQTSLRLQVRAKTRHQLARFLHYDPPASGQAITPATPARGKRIVVPRAARSLKVSELPVSVRLRHILERGGIKELGQLDGVALNALAKLRQCGKRTIAEVNRLVKRASAGQLARGLKRQ